MVIDSNILDDEILRDYLSKSRKTVAVITDYVMIEALKDDPLGKIFGLMKILSAGLRPRCRRGCGERKYRPGSPPESRLRGPARSTGDLPGAPGVAPTMGLDS
jgi:hypothetical protein